MCFESEYCIITTFTYVYLIYILSHIISPRSHSHHSVSRLDCALYVLQLVWSYLAYTEANGLSGHEVSPPSPLPRAESFVYAGRSSIHLCSVRAQYGEFIVWKRWMRMQVGIFLTLLGTSFIFFLL